MQGQLDLLSRFKSVRHLHLNSLNQNDWSMLWATLVRVFRSCPQIESISVIRYGDCRHYVCRRNSAGRTVDITHHVTREVDEKLYLDWKSKDDFWEIMGIAGCYAFNQLSNS